MKQLLLTGRILFFVVIYSHLHAQQLPITLYSSREGSPLAGAASVFQDKQGWIWFVSGYDVVRYDGYHFKTYPPTKKTKINYLFGLMQVNDEIWVRGYPNLLKISGDSLVNVESVVPSLVLQHNILHRGKIYFLEQRGLYLYQHDTLKAICRDNNLYAGVNSTLILYNDSLILSYNRYGQLIVFNLIRQTFSIIPLQITDMRQDSKGTIYFLLNKRDFYQLKNITTNNDGYGVETELYFAMPGENYNLSEFIIDRSKNFWIIEQSKQLLRISPSRQLTSYTETQGLPSLIFNDLLVDRENNLWIAFNGGICKISGGLWERFTRNEGIFLNHVLLMAKDGGSIFFSTQDGFNVYADDQICKVMQRDKPFKCNTFLFENKKLFYTRDSMLFSATFDEKKKQVVSEEKLAHLPFRSQELRIDKKGTLFIATNGGLYAWYMGRLFNPIPDSIHFREIIIDQRNHIWLGQFGGPVDHYSIQYDNGQMNVLKIETIIAPQEMPALELIRALEADHDGNIVVGTRYNGLFHLTVKADKVSIIKHFGTENGLSSKSIWGLTTADDGKIWIATAMGLNTISIKDGTWLVADEGRKRNIYATSDVLFDPIRQRIWVNNHPGVIYFDSKKIIHSYPFDVYVSVKNPGIKDFNDEKATTRFSYTQNNFSFEFSANSYLNEKAIQFTYRLLKKGDEEWSVPSTTHNVNYSSLNPGRYVFQVKALNTNNEWSSNEAVYSFRILPPFWQREWFIALMVLIIGAGFYALYRYRMRKMKELFEMRHVIANDLHDEIGSTLTSIHILSKVSHITVAKDQEKALSLLQKVIDQSHQIQQNMSDIVWAIRPDNDKMKDMIFRMREYLSQSLEPKNIAIDFVADEKVMNESLDMEQRRDFFLVFKEAVNNIAKYSQCRLTQIRVEQQNGNIKLLIQDDGVGFDMNYHGTSNGLKNMQKRAGLMKGSLKIQSAKGEGTRIELVVPAT